MICIECSTPVSSLYIKYSKSNIRLTRCPQCDHPCDVYIEYDKVILAIDLILLKPQAFKHLIYNSLIDTTDLGHLVANKFQHYKSIIRIALLILLFEVYLNWAYEEKKNSDEYFTILNCGNMFYQYSFFICQTLLVDFMYHLSIQLGLRLFHIVKYNYDILEFDDKNEYKIRHTNTLTGGGHFHLNIVIVSAIILLSSITKLLPVLIIIWPYDSATLRLIMWLIKITYNYFVLTLLHSCLSARKRDMFLILVVSNIICYLVGEIAMLQLVNYVFYIFS